jgi:hypothetical protein
MGSYIILGRFPKFPTNSPIMSTNNSARKPKEEDKEKKFLGKLTYKLDYDFEKSAVSELWMLRNKSVK